MSGHVQRRSLLAAVAAVAPMAAGCGGTQASSVLHLAKDDGLISKPLDLDTLLP